MHGARCNFSMKFDPWIRHFDDPYDRIWTTVNSSSYADTLLNTTEVKTESDSNLYLVPVDILQDAIIPKANGTTLRITSLNLSSEFYYYVYFYFAEIELYGIEAIERRREFNISLNNIYYKTVSPNDYIWPITVNALEKKPIKGDINISLDATKDSDLPPLLNAIEVYRVLPLPFFDTLEDDVNAVLDIKKTYEIANYDWQGDPCLQNFTWSGLDCKRDINPSRIISLNLSSHKLVGTIAPSIANLTALQFLDLSHNKLNGTIPEFLGELSSLKVIYLAGNKLSGSLPSSIIAKQKDGTLALNLCGNPNLELLMPCQIEVKTREKKSSMPIIIVSIVSSILGILVVVLSGIAFSFWRRTRTTNEGVPSVVQSVGNSSGDFRFKIKTREFKYSELICITDNFKNVIGEGGFGKVYRGVLEDGSEVAVKLLSATSRQGFKEFLSEAEILTKIHHRNLVSFVGYCDDDHNMALVYEYMANGNLRDYVSESSKNVLNWKDRLQVAIDSSRGLEYLHSGCRPPIIHRDLKLSNILLNEKLEAKIADFGLSKMFLNETDTNLLTTPAGTLGYLDPEYHRTGKLTVKSDVYSFGVVLLELITGRSSIIKSPFTTHITTWVSDLIEIKDIEGIMDPRLKGNYNINSAWKTIEVAMAVYPKSPSKDQT